MKSIYAQAKASLINPSYDYAVVSTWRYYCLQWVVKDILLVVGFVDKLQVFHSRSNEKALKILVSIIFAIIEKPPAS